MKLGEPERTRYLEAYERWKRDLDALHRVLLDGESLDPMHFVALLRRESKSKERYDEARREVLGLPGGAEEDPFA
ncbi:MAG TPA: hypothetical protein VFA70_13095 [Dehalococcoidia bacterium]|jgi:hypothetical protein|nr:hypothetical protein [Dehalococcoidia bacterium]